jgi:hypothetical protein
MCKERCPVRAGEMQLSIFPVGLTCGKKLTGRLRTSERGSQQSTKGLEAITNEQSEC